MANFRPELVEEVEDCIHKIKSFQVDKGRRISKSVKRVRNNSKNLIQLEQCAPSLPEDFLALYFHYNGAQPSASLSMWEWSIFLEFEWCPIDVLVGRNKIMRMDSINPLVDRFDTFHSPEGLALQLDLSAKPGDDVPLLMTLGSLSRNAYIAFDSTLAMLRSVCAVQDAGIVRYVEKGQRVSKANGVQRELNDIYYDVKELWDVIHPFNSQAQYWPALIDASLEWDEIEVEIPENGILNLSPEVREFIVGDPEGYHQTAEEEMRKAGISDPETQQESLKKRKVKGDKQP